MNRYKRDQLKYIFRAMIISAFGGAFFSMIMVSNETVTKASGLQSQLAINAYAALAGALMGLTVSASLSSLSIFIDQKMKKRSILLLLLAKPLVFGIVICLLYFIVIGAFFGSFSSLIRSENIQYLWLTMAFTFVITLIATFLSEMSRLLGQKAMQRLFFGKYRLPVEEMRTVMFLDLKGSTAIAESLGNLTFHSLLDDFFSDITPPIVESKGEIYKYVGDEVLITWPLRNAIRVKNAIECFFLVTEQVSSLAEKYKKKYDLVPEFRAGVHAGTVVVGQMGDYKREVAFLGDVMNTTARVTGEAAAHGEELLLTKDAVELLQQDAGHSEIYRFDSKGKIALRGKVEEMELFSVMLKASSEKQRS